MRRGVGYKCLGTPMYEGFSPGVSKIWGSAIPEKIDAPIWMLPLVSPGVCDFRVLILWGPGGSGRISRERVGVGP